MDEFKSKIGLNLHNLRIENNLSRKQVSLKTRVSVNSISSIENGLSIPKLITLKKILDVYNVTLYDFFKEINL